MAVNVAISGFGRINGRFFFNEIDASGFGNLRVGGKWRVFGSDDDSRHFGVGAFIEVPTGDDDEGVASGDTGFGANLAWDVGGWAFNLGYRDPGDPDDADVAGLEVPQELLAGAHAAMAEADVVVFSHPWLYPPLADEVRRRGLPVIYDSQNFEWRLRRELLGKTPLGAALADAIRFWEGEICRRADLVFVCSAEDRDGYVESYGVDPRRIEIVPNGVDTDAIRPAEENLYCSGLAANPDLTGFS